VARLRRLQPLHHPLGAAAPLDGYNNNYEIVQAPGLVAIVQEQVHETRMIRLATRAPAPDVRQWLGDSRGHA